MKALVTGGAGFIGSNIARLLLARGFEVNIIDNLSSGYRKNIDALQVRFSEADITDEKAVLEAMEGCDIVFHLAASVGRQKSLDQPLLDSTTNVLGTLHILEAMRKTGTKKIVYSSSAAIFGELLTPSIDEDHPQNADSPYGVSKLAAEKMILAYADLYDLTGVCLRYFNIYGKNQRFDLYGNVIPIFARRIFDGDPLTIYGDGEQTRDFLNVDDVARANLLASEKASTGVYNLGSGSSITINRLAEMMRRIAGKQVGVNHLPERPADVRHCKADAEKARLSFGFESKTTMEDGLTAYLRWFAEDNRSS